MNSLSGTFVDGSQKILWFARPQCKLSLQILTTLAALEVPVVEISNTGRQVGREAEPGKVGNLAPGGDLINRAPDVSQISIETKKGGNVNGSFDRSVCAEEDGHPGKVQDELEGVQSHALLSRGSLFGRGEEGEASGGRAMSSITHQAVESCQ